MNIPFDFSEKLIQFSRHDEMYLSNFTFFTSYSTFADTHIHKENTLVSYINNPFFPWLLLVLLINRNKWNKPIIYILIGFWFFHSSNYSLSNIINLMLVENKDNIDAYTERMWYLFFVLSPMLCFTSEIIGDWYFLLRTKAILCHERILQLYITCIFFNLTKACCFLVPIFFRPRFKDDKEDFERIKSLMAYTIANSLVIQIVSVIYDVMLIYYLRKNLFKKYKDNKVLMKNNFFEKLKQTSEYRIIISVILSLIIIPVTIVFYIFGSQFESIYTIMLEYRYSFSYINYYVMYMDQILLRIYADKNKEVKLSSISSFVSINETTSSPPQSNAIPFIENDIKSTTSSCHSINMPSFTNVFKCSNSQDNSHFQKNKSFIGQYIENTKFNYNSIQ